MNTEHNPRILLHGTKTERHHRIYYYVELNPGICTKSHIVFAMYNGPVVGKCCYQAILPLTRDTQGVLICVEGEGWTRYPRIMKTNTRETNITICILSAERESKIQTQGRFIKLDVNMSR
jgi:hypothetical protein